jgi:Tol biopolymer transport system component
LKYGKIIKKVAKLLILAMVILYLCNIFSGARRIEYGLFQIYYDLSYYFDYLKNLEFLPKKEIPTVKEKIVLILREGSLRIPDIYVINSDGSNLTKLLTLKLLEYEVVPSPDGKKLAITALDGLLDHTSDVYIIDINGHNLIQVTNGKNCENPSWRTDGKELVFVGANSSSEYPMAPQNLYTVNSDGSNLTKLPTPPGQYRNPYYMPDGKSIIYYFDDGKEGSYGIYIRNENGEIRKLTLPTRIVTEIRAGEEIHLEFNLYDFSLSPNGEQIVVTGEKYHLGWGKEGAIRKGFWGGLYLMGVSGDSNVTTLVEFPNKEVSKPCWSGEKIFFELRQSRFENLDPSRPKSICAINVDGSNFVEIFKEKEP